MARLIADENIQSPLVEALREDGHDVLYITEYSDGITDEEVLSIAADQQRLLLTEDKDFGELVFRLKRGLPGVILFRMADVLWHSRYKRLTKLFQQHAKQLDRKYIVVEGDRFRFRSMP